MKCGGVLIPDGTRHCFVDEGRLTHFTEKQLRLETDHIIPVSMGGTDGPTHLVHAYCQRVQGGKIGGSITGAKNFSWEDRSRGGKLGAQNIPHEARMRGALAGNAVGNHIRWHVNAGMPCTCREIACA